MPNQDYALMMARYNQWQNDSLIEAANSLDDVQRKTDRGSFFGSIQNTFSHILWADQLWLSRFAGTAAPKGGITQSVDQFTDWSALCPQRTQFDKIILNWAKNVKSIWFSGDLSWFSGAINQEVTKPKKLLILQFFNHQTHHRGQIHAMLTAAGAHPNDTDVPFMPNSYLDR